MLSIRKSILLHYFWIGLEVVRSTFADCRSQFLLDQPLGKVMSSILKAAVTIKVGLWSVLRLGFGSKFGLEVFLIREKTPKPQSAGSMAVRATDRSERRNNLKGNFISSRQVATYVTIHTNGYDDFVGAPKPPQSKRKLSALQRSSQARQRMRRCGSSLAGNLHMRIT